MRRTQEIVVDGPAPADADREQSQVKTGTEVFRDVDRATNWTRTVAQTEDVVVDRRGYIYISDKNQGIQTQPMA